jgi:hypothetical protein
MHESLLKISYCLGIKIHSQGMHMKMHMRVKKMKILEQKEIERPFPVLQSYHQQENYHHTYYVAASENELLIEGKTTVSATINV